MFGQILKKVKSEMSILLGPNPIDTVPAWWDELAIVTIIGAIAVSIYAIYFLFRNLFRN